MAKKKFYAVAAGRKVGIYTDWSSAEKQVKGFAGAKYKSFPTEIEAKQWLKDPVYEKNLNKKRSQNAGISAEKNITPDGVVVYTDGGSINNPGPGGFGIVIEEKGTQREMSGGFRLTTNNRMEMMAAIVALKELQGRNKRIHLFSDSSYLVNGVTKGWARKWQKNGWRKSDGQEALNRDLWEQLLLLLQKQKITFHWVKGHAGNPLNERCDQLAVAAAKSRPTEVDTEYERLNS